MTNLARQLERELRWSQETTAGIALEFARERERLERELEGLRLRYELACNGRGEAEQKLRSSNPDSAPVQSRGRSQMNDVLREAANALDDLSRKQGAPARIAHELRALKAALEQLEWVAVEKAKVDAYADAVRVVEKIAEDYIHEHGSYDGSTNAWDLNHRHMEKIEAWDDAVEALRKRKAEKCHVTHAAPVQCGCVETYPQLVPGKVSHGPGCPHRPESTAKGEKHG
jgi:ribonuclease HI